MLEFEALNQSAFLDVLLLTINITLTMVVLLLACLCCKRNKIPKNDLLGLEGMVKLKNPDDVVVVTTVIGKSESQLDLNASTISNADSEKRASTAAHRSLPDIPIAEANGDTGSELYETVADKRLMEAQNSHDKSPSPNLKKQKSISQHSSISQADDVSSPYSRVKNSPHGYAKVLSTEHPYAQLNAPSTSAAAAAAAAAVTSTASVPNNQNANESVHSSAQHNSSTQDLDNSESQVDIPAASAIAGMISASQDLPYMTPPVTNQHFSGDSQDSSKGYTSISVREPLANILAQQPLRPVQRNSTITRDVNDSHYATVSDDSDETYAAIEDPNLRNNANIATDIYTSGSETYAQIQPMQSVVVSVEINNPSATSNYRSIQPIQIQHNVNNIASVPVQAQTTHTHALPHAPHMNWPSVQASQMHSRQASSSSNNSSSVGNLGSPKPEKRQANSPLPPTPKSALHNTSNTNLTSGRNSVISVIELTGETATEVNDINLSNDSSPLKKHKSLSPSRDIEGMYAKVMKKSKFSTRDSPSSQNNSPIMIRKHNSESTAITPLPLNPTTASSTEAQKINVASGDRNRARCNSYGAKDHGYETIPADINRKSDCYTNFLQKERQLENNVHNSSVRSANNLDLTTLGAATISNNVKYQSEKHYETIAAPNTNSTDPGYETLIKPKSGQTIEADNEKKSFDYDPNYEIVQGPNNTNSAGLSDDGYAKVVEKKTLNIDEDSIDGYSKVKGDEGEDGYSTIREFKEQLNNHNYASILEAKSNEITNTETVAEGAGATTSTSTTSFSPKSERLSLISASTPVKGGNVNALAPTEYKKRPNELPPILSPTSFNSSSILNTSSATSSANLTTTSTMSTLSSRQTPSSSQYESLTGSDTDPNYESVSYVPTNRSISNTELHPYERLNADYTDTQPSSPRTPPEAECSTSVEQSTLSHSISTTGAAVVLNVTTTHTTITTGSTTCNQTEVMVDDYFQV